MRPPSKRSFFWFSEKTIYVETAGQTTRLSLSSRAQILAFICAIGVVFWISFSGLMLFSKGIGAPSIPASPINNAINTSETEVFAEELNAITQQSLSVKSQLSAALVEMRQMQNAEITASEQQEQLQYKLALALNELQALKRQHAGERNASAEGSIAPNALSVPPRPEQASPIDKVSQALSQTAKAKLETEQNLAAALSARDALELEIRLIEQKYEQLFRQIEEALTISVKPLDKVLRASGLNSDSLLNTVRQGYSGRGGPAFRLETNLADLSAEEARALGILNSVAKLDHYRIAINKLPFAPPVTAAHRFTSGFGPRWGRMHRGIDLAAPKGTPILATADGVVTFAGTFSSYGKLVKIKHDFGYETRYGHLSKIRVKKGQRVSRGESIGGMGNTGRSTGTHLHYELRYKGKALNPMNYIKAAKDVF